jgi:GTP cyclohydrolase I
VDRDKMQEGIRLFLEGLERRFDGDDLARTPERVTRAWIDDLVSGYSRDPDAELTWTAAPEMAGPIIVRRISVASICVHHLLPFHGTADVVYLPGKRLAGLSKLGRVVDAHARRLQTQEHLTEAVASTIEQVLAPRGVLVRVEAAHTCMTLRGVRKEQARMLTLAGRGQYADDLGARGEILYILGDTTASGGA